MAVAIQFRNILRICFGVVLSIAFISLLSAIFQSSRSHDILGAKTLESGGGRDEDRHGAVKTRCTTARQEEVEQLIQKMETKERSNAFEQIFAKNYWGGGETRSGPGSRRDYTENVRKLIGFALRTYDVQELLDAPCGDVNWQPLIPGFNSTKYTGFDIVPDLIESNKATFKDWPNMTFARVDFINTLIDDMVDPDLIICRDAIQHNTLKDGLRGLVNLESTGAKYFITNWHSPPRPNKNIHFGGFYLIDVFTPPFNFSNPEMFISEGVGGYNSEGKFVGLWKLPAMLRGDGKPFNIPPSLNNKVRQEVVMWAEIEEERVKASRSNHNQKPVS